VSAQSVVASNLTLGLLLAALLVATARRNRPFLRELIADPDPGWRRMPVIAAGGLAVAVVWISLFDNWRQLTGIPFRATRRFDYQRIVLDPPSTGVRAVTFALVGLAVVLVGALVARHVGGYVLQLVLAAGAAAAWLPFFVIRQRFALDLAMGFTGSWTSPTDVAGYVAFILIGWGFEIGLIVVSFAALLGIAALPVTLVLDLLRIRRPRITKEADPFFNAIGGRGARP
jgi:hypothetical protein